MNDEHAGAGAGPAAAAAAAPEQKDEENVGGLDDDDDDSSATITLVSKDGRSFSVRREAALLSSLCATALESDADATEVRMEEVDAQELDRVCTFLEHEASLTAPERLQVDSISKPLKSAKIYEAFDKTDNNEAWRKWYADFADLDPENAMKLLCAANYMDVKPLLSFLAATVATFIKGKTPEDIKEVFKDVDATRQNPYVAGAGAAAASYSSAAAACAEEEEEEEDEDDDEEM
jgi:S-phase kinase-associated protein 1